MGCDLMKSPFLYKILRPLDNVFMYLYRPKKIGINNINIKDSKYRYKKECCENGFDFIVSSLFLISEYITYSSDNSL